MYNYKNKGTFQAKNKPYSTGNEIILWKRYNFAGEYANTINSNLKSIFSYQSYFEKGLLVIDIKDVVNQHSFSIELTVNELFNNSIINLKTENVGFEEIEEIIWNLVCDIIGKTEYDLE